MARGISTVDSQAYVYTSSITYIYLTCVITPTQEESCIIIYLLCVLYCLYN